VDDERSSNAAGHLPRPRTPSVGSAAAQLNPGWPVGPPGRPVSGNLRDLREDRLGFFARCAGYGDFVPFRLKRRRVVFLSDPDFIETVVWRRAEDYSKDYLTDLFHPVLRKHLLLSDTDSWLEQRRLSQPALRPDRIAAYADVMADRAGQLGDMWEEGRRVDVASAMRRLTLEILAATVFEVDVTAEAADAGDIIDTVLEDFNSRIGARASVPFVLPTPRNLRLIAAFRRLDGMLDRLIDGRRTDADGREDLLSRLVTEPGRQGTARDNADVKLTALPLFFAGHETTAMTLTWCLYLLARDPEAQDRVGEEVDRVLGSRRPGADELRTLPYLGNVVHEALRLYPPIWGFGRMAVRDSTVGPYHIPAGTTVFMSQWTLHRDTRWFERPDAFEPDRWGDGLASRLPRCAYLPFGVGPRRCLGNTYALVEAAVVLACLCRRFRFEPVEAGEPAVDPVVTLRPRGPVELRVRHRAG
jgi:cytochrome P450